MNRYVITTTDADTDAGYAPVYIEVRANNALNAAIEAAKLVHGVPLYRLTVMRSDDDQGGLETIGTLSDYLN